MVPANPGFRFRRSPFALEGYPIHAGISILVSESRITYLIPETAQVSGNLCGYLRIAIPRAVVAGILSHYKRCCHNEGIVYVTLAEVSFGGYEAFLRLGRK